MSRLVTAVFIASESDLFDGHRIEIARVVPGYDVAVRRMTFAHRDGLERFEQKVVRYYRSKGVPVETGLPDSRNRSADAIDEFGRMARLLRSLESGSDVWSPSETLRTKVRALGMLVNGMSRVRPDREHQPRLFTDDAASLGQYYSLSFDVAFGLLEILIPHLSKDKRAFATLLRPHYGVSGLGITRLASSRRDVLDWSLFTFFGDGLGMHSAARSLAARGISSVRDLLSLSEEEAFAQARCNAAMWLRIRMRVASHRLEFALSKERAWKRAS